MILKQQTKSIIYELAEKYIFKVMLSTHTCGCELSVPVTSPKRERVICATHWLLKLTSSAAKHKNLLAIIVHTTRAPHVVRTRQNDHGIRCVTRRMMDVGALHLRERSLQRLQARCTQSADYTSCTMYTMVLLMRRLFIYMQTCSSEDSAASF
jgi:hypothetical protein